MRGPEIRPAVNRIAQCGIAIDAGVPEIADGCEAAFEVLARHLSAQQYAFAGRFNNRQQQVRSEVSIVSARALGRRRHHHVQEQVGVGINQPRQQSGAAQIDCLGAGGRMRLQLQG